MSFRFEHVHLKTADPHKTARFYMDSLGATLIEATHGDTRFRLNLHGVTLNITGFMETQQREQRYGIEHLSLETDALDDTLRTMVEKGGRVLEQVTVNSEGRTRRIAFVEGPDGIQVELIEL